MAVPVLKRFPAKRTPGSLQKTRQNKGLRPRQFAGTLGPRRGLEPAMPGRFVTDLSGVSKEES